MLLEIRRKTFKKLTFHTGEDEIKSIWVLNPFKNWGAIFTGFGIVTTLVIILIICLITKKGYIWFSGYKYTPVFPAARDGFA